ncbi:MAG TPA: response regulator [Rhodocyclaceae bacterium]|nr:response regulator [Rhodocyclaceae bacterium]
MASILVVEDNPSNMKLVSLILDSMGHNVIEAHDAPEGIQIAKTQNPVLILMDIQLPGMDGLEATRRLKQDSSTQSIKVVALTAFAMKGDEERILAAGCDAYISKPIQHLDFVAKINELLASA